MHHEEFRTALACLGWSTLFCSRLLSASYEEAQRWAAGTEPVPYPVAVWLREVAAALQALPPPVRWR